MLQLARSEARKGSNHPLHWTPERDAAFEHLKRELLKPLAPFLVNHDKPFVIRTDASDYAMSAVLEQANDKGNHYPVAFWSCVFTPSQRGWQTPGPRRPMQMCAPYANGRATLGCSQSACARTTNH